MPKSIEVDVAVVGGGISGLTAARRLDQAGVEVCVVEASGRVGGRLLNAEVAPGVFLEVGGRFVGGTQRHILGLVEEVGGSTFGAYTWGGDAVWHYGGERLVGGDRPPMSTESKAAYDLAIAEFDALSAKIDPTEPWSGPDAAAIDRLSFESWLLEHLPDERARWAFLFEYLIGFVVPPWRVSLLHAAATWSAMGGFDGIEESGASRIVGGGAGICDTMATELGDKVRLSAPVETIEWGGSNVVVRADGVTVEARRCVVAMSPVSAHRIKFEPGLPWDRDNFHRHAQAGGGVMTVLVYDTPFWRERGLSGEAGTDLPGGTHLNDNSPADGSVGVINSFVAPLPPGMPWGAPRAALDTPELRRQAVTDAAVAAFREEAANPVNYVEKDWLNERFIPGVQHGMPPGLITEAGPSMLGPTGPLHWCSAEHGTCWPMVMNGAVESGERVAAEVQERLGG